MSDLPPITGSKRWMLIGAVMIACGLLADSVGVGGARGLGMRETAPILLGAGAIAAGLWGRVLPVRPLACLGVWIAFGLVCGLFDYGRLMFHRHVDGVLIHLPDEAAWVLPLGCGMAFALLGLLHAAAGRFLPPLRSLPVVAFVPASILAWATLSFGWLDDVARLALACGVGVSAARWAIARPDGLRATSRRCNAAIGTLALVAMAAIALGRGCAERRANADLPAPAPDAPNVLLIVLDTVRADHLGCYGYHRDTTPALDALAADGVLFERVVATSPWTLPTHASLFTGRYHHEVSADSLVALDDTHATLAERLTASGYDTAGVVGNLLFCAAETGLARGFTRYEDYAIGPALLLGLPTLGKVILQKALDNPYFFLLRNHAAQVTDRFLGWLDDRGERPFFAFLNYYDAHALYLNDPPYDEMFGRPSALLYQYHSSRRFTLKELQGFANAYDGGLRTIDDQLDRLFDELLRRELLDDTLVVVTADHGELFGEHRLRGHANCLYDPVLRAPLILHWPGRVPTGRRVAIPASLRDVAATVLDLVGAPPSASLPGHSLSATWRAGGAATPSPLLAELSQGINRPAHHPNFDGPMKSIYLDGLHYIRNGDGSEELYDLDADPVERSNLIETRPDDAQRLRAAVANALSR